MTGPKRKKVSGASIRRIKHALFLLPVWQRWCLTIFIMSFLIGSWFFLMYAPLTTEVQHVYDVHAQAIQQKKLITTYKKQLAVLQESIASLKKIDNRSVNNRDFLIKMIAHEAHDQGVDLKECCLLEMRSHQNKTTCKWCLEGEHGRALAYLHRIVDRGDRCIVNRLSCETLQHNVLRIQGLITEL